MKELRTEIEIAASREAVRANRSHFASDPARGFTGGHAGRPAPAPDAGPLSAPPKPPAGAAVIARVDAMTSELAALRAAVESW
jgi:hypothetical protein